MQSMVIPHTYSSLRVNDVIIDQKLDKHVDNSVKRREPTIQRLVKSYNDMCTQMHLLAPRRAYLPRPLERSGLYQLDVDDPIWHDAGLGDETEDAVPRWMSDETVRKGIKCLLELDRCIEEEHRLQRERCTLQEWLREEWECLLLAVNKAGA
jgi:hypothetical protein